MSNSLFRQSHLEQAAQDHQEMTLGISRNGYSIVSLGNLFQCSLTLTVKKVFLYGQKSVLAKSTNTIFFQKKPSFSRETLGILTKNKKPESSSSKSRKLSLLVHATAM